MSDMDDWSAAQFRDECERMREIIASLEAAEKAGTPKEHLIVLAHEAGVASIYNGGKQ